MKGQSGNPIGPYDVRQVEGVRVIDVHHRRTYLESKTNFRAGDIPWTKSSERSVRILSGSDIRCRIPDGAVSSCVQHEGDAVSAATLVASSGIKSRG